MTIDIERNKELLRRHFPKLNDSNLIDEIAACAQLFTFPEGQVILNYGDNIRMVPLVISGSIKVMRQDTDGNELFLYYLSGGDACATSFTCCMTAKQSYMKTVAEKDSVILGLPIKKTDEWMSEYRVWKNFVMQAYDARVLELVRTIDNIAFMKTDERLYKYLQKTAQTSQTNIIKHTHQHIANDLHASREAVSRLLKKLEKKNLIKLGRNRIEILNR